MSTYNWSSETSRERYQPLEMSEDVIDAVQTLAGHMAQRHIDMAEERGDEPDADETLGYRNSVADALMLIVMSRSSLVTSLVDSGDVELLPATRAEFKLKDGADYCAGNTVMIGCDSKRLLAPTYHAAKESLTRILRAGMEEDPKSMLEMLDQIEALAAVLAHKKAGECDCDECRARREVAKAKADGTIH